MYRGKNNCHYDLMLLSMEMNVRPGGRGLEPHLFHVDWSFLLPYALWPSPCGDPATVGVHRVHLGRQPQARMIGEG